MGKEWDNLVRIMSGDGALCPLAPQGDSLYESQLFMAIFEVGMPSMVAMAFSTRVVGDAFTRCRSEHNRRHPPVHKMRAKFWKGEKTEKRGAAVVPAHVERADLNPTSVDGSSNINSACSDPFPVKSVAAVLPVSDSITGPPPPMAEALKAAHEIRQQESSRAGKGDIQRCQSQPAPFKRQRSRSLVSRQTGL